MSSMRAAVVAGPNRKISIETIARPRPGRGEVLLKVEGCGACHTDLHVLEGKYAFPYPCVLGHEVAGRVVELGEGVETTEVGARVVASFVMPCGRCDSCGRGEDNLCEKFFAMNRGRGHLYDDTSRLARDSGQELAMFSAAGLAEYSVVPCHAVFPVPDELDLRAASIVGCSVLTAYGAARYGARLLAGQTVAVVAVGGVGLSLVQMARAFGASQIIAVDVRADKLDMARRLGATDTVDSTETDCAATVRRLTNGRGVDAAFEALGQPRTFEQAFMMTADGGVTVLVGVGIGDAAASIPLGYLLRHQIKIVGSYGGRPRTDMPVVLRMAARGQLDLDAIISGYRPLTDVQTVYHRLADGEVAGRVVLIP
ncbi:zinc-binding dehydrogenase [Nocardia callitridis]|uniref:Zinc-binding dehydrogenase n=1 Tax=Nocardia callitridis TaxID=648753 RepID=A0ABP9KQF6_9NOCA